MKQCLQTAWFIVNDSLRTDLCLLYPPYMIALASIYITAVLHESEIKRDMCQWFAELNVDLNEIVDIAREILRLYSIWGEYDQTRIQTILNKLRPQSVNRKRKLDHSTASETSEGLSS